MAEHFEEEPEDRCCDCGAMLTDDELSCSRDMCFACYCFHQD